MKLFNRHVSRQLPAFLDGRLMNPALQRVEAHLAGCARCREELEQVRLGMQFVLQLPLVAAPDSVWSSILHAAEAAQRRPEPWSSRWRFAVCTVGLGVLLVAVAGYWMRESQGRWDVVRVDGSPAVGDRPMAAVDRVWIGEWVQTDGRSRARLHVGRIGTVDVGPDTRVRVDRARGQEHRLALGSGTIHAKISAPPRLFFVETAAGTAVDLGCEYDLTCDRNGDGLLRVTAGWVSYDWQGRESLVPAGAQCRTRSKRGPGTPFFEDAAEGFVAALVVVDSGLDSAAGGQGALEVVLSQSRVRDTLTLWHLLSRTSGIEREHVYRRMAALATPPAGVQRQKVMELDRETLERWRGELAWTW